MPFLVSLSLLVSLALAEAPPAGDPLGYNLPADSLVRPFVPAPPHDPVPADYGIIFFGDSGSGSRAQSLVARRVAEFCATARCDAAVLLGDNFYPRGVTSADDPLWTTLYTDIYGSLDLPFWVALGNHDYLGDPDAQVGWKTPAETASTWNMPARHYSWALGPIRLIAIDSNQLGGAQKRWFRSALQAPAPAPAPAPDPAGPSAQWTVVYGHHPLWSGGAHGDSQELRSWAPLLQRADFYLCGHDHDQQVIVRPGLVEVVMGGGGAGLRPAGPIEGTRFVRSEFGFGYLAVKGDSAEVLVVNIDGSVTGRFPFTHAEIEAPPAPP